MSLYLQNFLSKDVQLTFRKLSSNCEFKPSDFDCFSYSSMKGNFKKILGKPMEICVTYF